MSAHRSASGLCRKRLRRLGQRVTAICGLTVCASAIVACTAQPPDVEPRPSAIADAGASAFVDLVVSYTQDGVPVTCTDELAPICQAPSGACSNHEALGPPDGRSIVLPNAAQLEVGFLCQPIVDRAPNSDLSPDFVVWGTVDSGSGAVVSVSEDGSEFIVLDHLLSDNQSFDLANRGLEYARFVRIVTESGSQVSIDAIEALP